MPRFPEFKYYYLLDVVGMSEFNYALLFILSSLSMVLCSAIFHYVFSKFSYRQGFAVGFMFTTVTTFFDIIFVLRLNKYIYISDYIFVIFTNLLEDMGSTRHTVICNGVVHTRIAP